MAETTEQGALFPFNDPIATEVGGRLMANKRWRDWFLRLRQSVDLSSLVRRSLRLENQSAAIAVTSLEGGTVAAGLYVVSWYLSVTTPAGVSSSATVTIGWTDNGQAKSYTGPAMNGNSLATSQGEQRVMFYSDAAPITYAVAYASNPAAAMVYDLRIVLQSVAVAA